jgi:hypothetical protein
MGSLRRTIQDCLGWAFEYIHQCQQSKKEIVIIKLDFTKAFDMIEHLAIIQMMQQLGFSEKWINWTTSILSTTLICATSTTNSLK